MPIQTNFFWNAIKSLSSSDSYSPEVTREVNAVLSKDQEIEREFGIERSVFQSAEHQKHIKGGLNEDSLREELSRIGFSKVEFIYHWYIGQAFIVNHPDYKKDENLARAGVIHSALINMLPLSRHLFKYVGFVATK